MNHPTQFHRTLLAGDRVTYYLTRRVSFGTGFEQVRRTGIVQGWRNGKVIVLHKAGYTEDLAEVELYYVE